MSSPEERRVMAGIFRTLIKSPQRKGENLFRRGSLHCRVDGAEKWVMLRTLHTSKGLGHTLTIDPTGTWALRESGTVSYTRESEADPTSHEIVDAMVATFTGES